MGNLETYRNLVNLRLEQLFAQPHDGRPELLNDAMWYSVKAGGKRLRPCMLLAAVEMLSGDVSEAMDFACAVEMIHTYSLIHDDLPGMDNDSMRRGRPTNHVVYGVGQAILAGDGLLNLAFETMLNASSRHPERAAQDLLAIGEIAKGSGVTGMVAGQCLDLECERNVSMSGVDVLEKIHEGKTACMFVYPLRAAARLCAAEEETLSALTQFGKMYGLLFQAADDLTDVVGNSAEAGKTLGKDAESGKLTCVSIWGVEGTRERIARLQKAAIHALDGFDARADFFRTLAEKAAQVS